MEQAHVSANIPVSLNEQLKKVAYLEERSKASVITRAIRDYCKKAANEDNE